MTSITQRFTDLLDAIKEAPSFSLELGMEKASDPTKRPPGTGWKTAMSLQVAMQNASKEVMVIIGPTTNAYYYK